MREMKDSGVEWIGKIPKEWHITQTRRLFRNEKNIVGDAADEYERLALTLKGVIKRSKNDSEGLQPEKFEGYQILRQNELVFKMIDLENVNTSRVGLSPYTGLVSPAYIVLKNDSDDNRYEYYWFMSMYYNEVFNHLGGDGVRSALNVKDMLSLPIPNISKIQKKMLADYLDAKCSKIDEIIEKQQAIIEKLKAYKLSIITEGVTKGLKHNVKMKDSGVRFVDTIPYNWENRKMITILSTRVVDGPHESPELYDTGIPYISATAIVNGKIDFSLMRGYISKEYCEICDKRYSPQRGDLLVVKLGASTGQVAIVDTDERFNIWVPLAAVRCNDEALPKFVYYVFQSDYFVRQMELSWTFGTQQTLGVQTIEKLRILLPPIAEQREIVKFLDTIYDNVGSKIENVEKMIEKLEEYKKSLIYEVVTGKKEV